MNSLVLPISVCDHKKEVGIEAVLYGCTEMVVDKIAKRVDTRGFSKANVVIAGTLRVAFFD